MFIRERKVMLREREVPHVYTRTKSNMFIRERKLMLKYHMFIRERKVMLSTTCLYENEK